MCAAAKHPPPAVHEQIKRTQISLPALSGTDGQMRGQVRGQVGGVSNASNDRTRPSAALPRRGAAVQGPMQPGLRRRGRPPPAARVLSVRLFRTSSFSYSLALFGWRWREEGGFVCTGWFGGACCLRARLSPWTTTTPGFVHIIGDRGVSSSGGLLPLETTDYQTIGHFVDVTPCDSLLSPP